MSKRVKLSMKQICTHSGSFHADEALAVFMLRILPEFKGSKLIRSRDPKIWEESDIVVDVSGKYDGKKYFDHHQREFSETFSSKYKTKLSSAGLVYKHYGSQIITALLCDISEDNNKILYDKVYSDFIEALDANDNGINNYDFDGLNVKPRFHDSNLTIPSIISRMNPNWNEDNSDAKFDEQFNKASDFIGDCFVTYVKKCGNSWLPAKSLVENAIKSRFEVDSSGEIIILEKFAPWKEHLYELEKNLNIKGKISFVLFQDSSNKWRVSTVPISSASFSFRKGLPEKLRGLRDEELCDASKVSDCIFIHASGFIGGAKSKEGVLELARMSL